MKRLLFLFSFFFLAAGSAGAFEAPVRASLTAEKEGIFPGDEIFIALQLDMPPGWHVYWKNSGDSGEPTELKLSLPEGFREIERLWPAPERFTVGEMAEYGYRNTAVLPVRIKAPDDLKLNEKVKIKGQAVWLSCKDECVPSEAEVSLFLTTGMESSGTPPVLTQALSEVPDRAPASFWDTKENFIIAAALPDGAVRAYFFPEKAGIVLHAGEQSMKVRDGRAYVFVPKASRARDVKELSGVLAFYGPDGHRIRAVEIKALPSEEELPDFSRPFDFADFAGALILAFAGGVLLNLMPCVFPVLSLKAVALMSSRSTSSPAALKREGLAYTAGVMVSFLVVGGVLLILRAAGTGLGWGFQLQYPPFVLLLCLFMFFLGLVFSGVISVGHGFAGLGQNRRWGNFGTGVLAVFVATPCAAPFMGAALGYGLTSPAPVTMAVFAVMGLGLSLPFLLLGLRPKLSRFLPKPGAWMELFRNFLAFPLYGTAGWLLWVLSAQEGSLALAAGVFCLIMTALGAWLWEAARCHPRLKRTAQSTAVLVLLLIAGAAYDIAPDVHRKNQEQSIPWQPYQAEVVQAYRKQGVPVFLKFSASWCLTCLVNEKVAFDSPEIAELFRSKGVAAFFGDWTTRDDRITKALEEYGRGGVPLYVYYAPFAVKPVILPQIITEGAVREALSGL